MKEQLKVFVQPHGGKIVLFKELPRPFQMAMIHYMAVDGMAWETLGSLDELYFTKYDSKIWAKAIRKSLSLYVEKYGEEKFGMVYIPSLDLIKAIWDSQDAREFSHSYKTFEAYAEWYRKGHITYHPKSNRWPVILGDNPRQETIQDGWHRFHCYVHQGAKIIPCIYYP